MRSVDPQTESIAADVLEVRSKCLEELDRDRRMEPNTLIGLQDRLEEDGRGYLARFSNNGTTPVGSDLLRMFHASRLSAVRSNLRRGYRAEDLEKAVQIIDRIDLDRGLRIEALFLRHQIRLLDPETRQEAIEKAPDIGYAMGLDQQLAMRRLVGELEHLRQPCRRRRVTHLVKGKWHGEALEEQLRAREKETTVRDEEGRGGAEAEGRASGLREHSPRR